MPLLRSAPVERRPIRRTSGWFEPEKLGGDAITEKTVPGIRSRGVRYWAERRGFWVVPPSTDVQDRLAGELPIDKPAGDVPISLHGASTAICGRNFFAAIILASSA